MPRVYGLIKAGVINSTSIGFIPIECDWIGPDKSIRRWTKSELIEFAFVSTPAQPQALLALRLWRSSTLRVDR
jgi:phage head maturation protease